MKEMDLSAYKKIANFDSTLIENMEILSSMNNYYAWLASLLRKHCGNKLLEIGCANGNLTRFFIGKPLVIGIDISRDYIKEIKNRFQASKNFDAFPVNIRSKSYNKLKKYKFDTVISMNTFEHIKNDVLAFKNTYNILEKRGKFLIIVPAMRFLYSIMDYEGGHFRRYTKQELASKLSNVGFQIKDIYYVNFLGALGWYFSQVLLQRRIYSKFSLSFYNKLIPALKFSEKIIRPPFGLSLVCIAQK